MSKIKIIKITFFDSKKYDQTFFNKEIENFNKENKNLNIEANYIEENLNLNILEKAKGSEVISVFVNDIVDSKVLEKAKEMGIKVVALRCAGFNNVDLQSAKNNQIEVCNVPAYSPHSVAEHAIALLLSLNRKIHRAYNRTRDNDFRIEGFLGFDLHGKTAGIIGTGKIGAITARILNGFGMKVLLHDKYENQKLANELNTKYVTKEELFEKSDVISLHCPLFPETKHILNKKAFEKMKNGVIIVNTSRGGLINSTDLVRALKSGKVGGAGLDVYEFEAECFFEDNSQCVLQDQNLAQLLIFNNVIVTPHQAFFTKEALDAISKTTIKNIVEFLENGEKLNSVLGK